MAEALAVCGNCDARLGRLERPSVWQGVPVCEACYDRLSRQSLPVLTPDAAPASDPDDVGWSVANPPVRRMTTQTVVYPQQSWAMAAAASPHVVVVKPDVVRGVSGFGIVAIVLGLVAALTSWIPFLGLLTLPIAGIGLLFGAIGLGVSLLGEQSGPGIPAAGTLLCLVAIGLALVSSTFTFSAIRSASQPKPQPSYQVDAAP